MSINQLDLHFPDISGKSTQEALQIITNYLYALIEHLRYTLNNLGAENFNDVEWATMQNGILKIVANDYVTFESLKTPGKVIIDGGNLKADGTIEGQNIRGGTIGIGGEGNNYNFFVDPEGNVTLNGDITWGAGASPVKVQYSVNGTSGWHDTFTAGDMFARYSYDGGQTWTAAMKVVAKDGRDGSDATVPGYITQTVIGAYEIAANTIRTNNLNVIAPSYENGLTLTSLYSGLLRDVLKISSFTNISPYVSFDSPISAYAYWNFPQTEVTGNVHFSGNVTGLKVRFT